MSNCPGGVPARAQESFQEVTRMKKRLLSILFTLAVCVGLLSVTALATDDGHTHSYTNGFCTENGCGAYQPAELKDGVYQIANAGQLYWFAGLVNGDASVCVGDVTKNTAANAVLTANITVNTGVLNADGTVNMGEQNGDGTSTVTFRTWTPIGWAVMSSNVPTSESQNMYAGTFDGKGHTITGLYLNDSNQNQCGLFGVITSGASVSNVTVSDSYINGGKNIGGVCGYNYGGTITGCTNSGTVTHSRSTGNASFDNTGGVCGYNTGTIAGCTNTGAVNVSRSMNVGGVCGHNEGIITGCTNSGRITNSDSWVGGICGENAKLGEIQNCFNSGAVKGNTRVGGVCGRNTYIITNCASSGAVSGGAMYYGGVCGSVYYSAVRAVNCYFNSDAFAGEAIGGLEGSNNRCDITNVEGKTAAQFASGEVAWLLRGGDTDNGSTWGQKIGTDPYPLPNGEKVYKTTPCVTYSNTSGTKEHTDVGGICADCGEVLGTISDPYEIGSQDALNAFVKAVNNGNVSINARLTTDGLTLTTPIGQDADGKRYTGTFDGGNHTLTVTLSGGQDTAPFAAIENTTIKNLRTTGTIQTGGKYAAGLVSNAWHTVTIENCYSDVIITSTVNGDGTHGGLVGRANHDNSTLPSANITIRNCGFAGQINGEKTTSCGGLMGWIHKGQTITVENCYVAGTFTVAKEGSDTICRNIESNLVTASVTNFYYLKKLGGFGGGNTDLQANCRLLTAAQFASGEAAYLLNGSASEGTPVWRQNLDNCNTPDAYPLPVGTEEDSTGIVYKVPKFDPCNSETGVEGYSNYNKSKLIHSLTDVTEVPATYESDGVKAHKHCTVCGKDFIGGVEQSTDDLKLPKLVMPIIPVIPTYPPTVTQPAEGGTVAVSPQAPAQGVTVTITPRPEDGYEVGGVSVTDRIGNPVAVKDNGNGTYSFTQPAGAVTVNVTFADKTQLAFTDVPADAYYYDAVQWAVKNGITYGTSDTTFSPDASCTRAQMAAFLWRAAGCPEPKGTSSFTDVPSDAYYAKAVAWAVENGITGGVGNDKFAPDDVCTRAQMAAFLCRLAGGKAEGTGTFTDVSADAYYAEAVQWAVENGITDGVGDNRFAPDATCTRAQIVTFLYRFFVK